MLRAQLSFSKAVIAPPEVELCQANSFLIASFLLRQSRNKSSVMFSASDHSGNAIPKTRRIAVVSSTEYAGRAAGVG
jgi:hypothetical protein